MSRSLKAHKLALPLLPLAALLVASNPALAQMQSGDMLTDNQQSTNDGITVLCRDELAGNPDLTDPAAIRLRSRCGEIVRQETELIGALPDALQEVQAEEIEILSSQGTEGSGNQLQNIGNRLQAIRAGAVGVSIAGANWNDTQMPTGGMASSDDFSRLGVFVNFNYASGDRDGSDNVDGFDFDTSGVTIGADYRFTDTFVAGIAYHYLDSEADIDNNYGEFETEGQTLSAYATTYGDNFYVEGSLSIGALEYDSTRIVDYHVDPTFHEVLSASPDGDQLTWSLGAGYLVNSGAFNQSYYAQVNAIDLEIDGYTESTNNLDNGAIGMTVDDQEIQSLQSELGAQFSYPLSQSFGVIVPYVDVSWIHEFENGDDPIISRYSNADLPADQNVNNVSFTTQTDELDSDYFRLSLGASIGFSGGLQMFVNYDTLLDLEDYTYNAITAGIRKEL
ncbi:MAG: autotransporter outer membrane beta-barrel domain-containing protein [Gammaproteobacteria bacterium]|nr:autotransporter outer membrane beta-barrel domain-containing protein [Gammaproteobacteria bacterium]